MKFDQSIISSQSGAGTGGLGLAIEGPSEAKMTCRDNRDGSCTVEYVPLEAGDYDISIKFADQSIPGSPFKVIFLFLRIIQLRKFPLFFRNGHTGMLLKSKYSCVHIGNDTRPMNAPAFMCSSLMDFAVDAVQD